MFHLRYLQIIFLYRLYVHVFSVKLSSPQQKPSFFQQNLKFFQEHAIVYLSFGSVIIHLLPEIVNQLMLKF